MFYFHVIMALSPHPAPVGERLHRPPLHLLRSDQLQTPRRSRRLLLPSSSSPSFAASRRRRRLLPLWGAHLVPWVSAAAHTYPHLQRLCVKRMTVSDSDLGLVVRCCPGFRELSVVYYDGFTTAGIEAYLEDDDDGEVMVSFRFFSGRSYALEKVNKRRRLLEIRRCQLNKILSCCTCHIGITRCNKTIALEMLLSSSPCSGQKKKSIAGLVPRDDSWGANAVISNASAGNDLVECASTCQSVKLKPGCMQPVL